MWQVLLSMPMVQLSRISLNWKALNLRMLQVHWQQVNLTDLLSISMLPVYLSQHLQTELFRTRCLSYVQRTAREVMQVKLVRCLRQVHLSVLSLLYSRFPTRIFGALIITTPTRWLCLEEVLIWRVSMVLHGAMVRLQKEETRLLMQMVSSERLSTVSLISMLMEPRLLLSQATFPCIN